MIKFTINNGVRDLSVISEKTLAEVLLVVKDWVDSDLDQDTQQQLANKSLRRRTGDLARMSRWRTEIGYAGGGAGNGYKVSIILDSTPYAVIHEDGGSIVPKTGKYLTVPMPAAMTKAGVLRKPATSWQDTTVIKLQDKRLFIVKLRGKDKPPIFLFALKKMVRIKPTHWISKAIDGALPKLVEAL
jgi:hypothetical protein